MPDPRKDTVEAGYDALAPRFLEWSLRVDDPVRDRLFDAFLDALPEGSSVLDIGCGAGIPWTRRLADRFRVTAMDISARQVSAARANVPGATVLHGDVAALVMPARSLDGVTALYAIPHVPREEHAGLLEQIARWLRPGGLLLAAFGADDAPDWTGEWLGTPMYFSSFGADENRRLLEAAGFETLEAVAARAREPEGEARFLWVLARLGPAERWRTSRAPG